MIREVELFDLDGELESVAIVDRPAIDVTFLCFAEEEPRNYIFADEDRHELVGAFLIPEKRMVRYDENDEPFYVFFSRETVERLAHSFLSNRQMNIGHKEDTDKLVLLESWLKENEQDKSAALGLNLPIGSWVGKVKVLDEELWASIKEGKYNGFSIAGEFTTAKSQEFAAEEDADERLLNEIKSLIDECDE